MPKSLRRDHERGHEHGRDSLPNVRNKQLGLRISSIFVQAAYEEKPSYKSADRRKTSGSKSSG
jgi:hypothetical protein